MIASGTQLGSYRVDSLIGEGGMGQVYRGLDTRLGRTVAIKVLPSHLSSNELLRERFEREARAISALSHPHICTLFDVGRHDGIEFLVMEHLEGETLADRLARGPLPLEQVIRYGSEIAGALASAHRSGIVHRDLKPGNVMITKSGAKLLDFGLAKVASPVLSSPDAPTEQHKPLTAEGTLLGTFQYMAPEQVEGRDADTRTDMFAFGALLYEMVTGKRAFDGSSKASVIASILNRQPPSIASAAPATPPALDRLIRACLAKNPDERLQSAQDAALQMQWIGEAPEGEVQQRVPRWRKAWLPAVLLALLALAVVTNFIGRSAAPQKGVHLSMVPPPGYDMDLPAISPSGDLAFFADRGTDRVLFVRGLNEAQPRQLTAAYGQSPFWSPDGKWIGYFSGSRILKIAATGGTPEVVAEVGPGYGGSWSSDGTIVYGHGSNVLHAVSSTGGRPRVLSRLDAARREHIHGWPVTLPDGAGVLYLAASLSEANRIFHIPLRGGTTTEIMAADAIVGYSDPYLLFVRQGDIYAVRFDAKKLRVTGEPRRIAEQVHFDANEGAASASVNAEGILVFRPRYREKRRMVWYDRAGQPSGIALEAENITRPRLSPDGRRMLLTQFIGESGTRGVFSVDLIRGTRTLLTPPPRVGFDPVWLRDGERFVFSSATASGDTGLFVQHDDPQSPPLPLWVGSGSTIVFDAGAGSSGKEAVNVTPDGKQVIVREWVSAASYDLWLVPVDGSPRAPLLRTPASESWADISPNGRLLAYTSDATGTQEVYVRPFQGGKSVRVSTTGAAILRWSRDGTELFFNSLDKTLMSTRVVSAEPLDMAPPERLFQFESNAHYSYELSVDGKKFLVNELADPASAIRSYDVTMGWKQAVEEQ